MKITPYKMTFEFSLPVSSVITAISISHPISNESESDSDADKRSDDIENWESMGWNDWE